MELLEFATKWSYFWFNQQYFLQLRGVAMGAKFASSLANLFMAKWEEDVVYTNRDPALIVWGRYIDDILVLWRGSVESLDLFFQQLNNNDRGISLSYVVSRDRINFLDLEIRIWNGRFQFQTYFKPMDRNGFIPTDSCHQRSWLDSIPLSQFLRLRRNCSDINTFKTQSDLLKTTFLDKDYDSHLVEREFQHALETNRESLIEERPKNKQGDTFRWSMLTSFSIQHKQVRAILSKHWDILKSDRVLSTALPDQAKVIFRGAPTLQSKIAPNITNPPIRQPLFHEMEGFYSCRKCTVCQHNSGIGRKTVSFTSSVTHKQYSIKQFCTCTTSYIVYLITCHCGKQYVGRTIRSFSVRVAEHIALIKSGDTKHTVPRHYKLHHNRVIKGTQFVVIDRYVPPWRGGAMTRGVSRLETFWIHELRTHFPLGMNVELDINAFINRAWCPVPTTPFSFSLHLILIVAFVFSFLHALVCICA